MTYSNITNVICRAYVKSLEILRDVWRPIGSLSIAVAIFVNGVYLPLHLKQMPSLVELAALVTAFAPLAAVRTWEKRQAPVGQTDP